MMCLNALWEIAEGNVEDVRKVVAQSRPLAYTTVLTLLDRLARRGAVSRRKEGRGFRYQPTVARDKLRRMALRQFLEYHFDGSEAKLKVFLEQPVEAQAAAASSSGGSAASAIGPGEPEAGVAVFATGHPDPEKEA
jgi:predicted transcriptional regulator